ncbi:hypothetical protein Tco_0762852 [Tanacetum coccineum]
MNGAQEEEETIVVVGTPERKRKQQYFWEWLEHSRCLGRGSISIGGRGNKSADEWCPSPYIFGDERLDVHEDNKEHTEHVVGSSQNQVGFYDPAISRHAVRLIKTMFKGAYATWTKVPQDHRDRSFIDGRMQKAIRFVMLRNLI